MKPEIRYCIVCGNEIEFISRHWHYSIKKYCSEECKKKKNKEKYIKNRKLKWKPLKKQCVVCNKIFIQKQHHQKYCSPSCGKKISAKGNFLELRFKVFKRDNFTCQYCGRNIKEDKIKLECDHIFPKSKGGKDKLDNLITSCSDCNCGKGDVILEHRQIIKLKELNKKTEKEIKKQIIESL